MNRGQGHGDHIEAIMEPKDFIQFHLRDILSNSKVHHKIRTNVVSDSVKDEVTNVFSLISGDGDIKWIGLLAEGTKEKVNEFVSCFPILDSLDSIPVKITEVEEWSNHIEATITCEVDGEFDISFFATDYSWNKNKYVVGNSLSIDLAALAYKVKKADTGFKFEGQQAIDFLSKIGQKPTFNLFGEVEPVNFNTANLIALLQTNKDYPEDYEFQSPCSHFKHHETRGVKMTSCRVHFKNDPVRDIILYARTDMFADIQPETPIRGMLWMQGKISEFQHNEIATTGNDESSVDQNSFAEPAELACKGAEFISLINNKNNEGAFERFEHLNWLLHPLDQIRLRSGFVLDAFQVGDRLGAIYQLYVCEANSVIEYKPNLQKREERDRRKYMSAKEREKAGTFVDAIEPYDDSMYISQRLDYDEAKNIPDIWGYLAIPFTPMGIWQAFLLKEAHTLMPLMWHAGYGRREFIFSKNNIQDIVVNRVDKLSDNDYSLLLDCMQTDELFPHVTINGSKASITFCYWNDWSGLNKTTIQARQQGSSISFGEEDRENIISYNCGIRF